VLNPGFIQHHKVLFVALSGALLVLVGVVDYLTGREVALSLFYLLPIFASTLAAGLHIGLVMATGATICWFLADVLLSPGIDWIHYWNTAIRGTFFLVFVLLLNRVFQALERERSLARTDLLTGLGNTRSFLEDVNNEIGRSRTTGAPLSLAYLDCDNFKQVNDERGHEAGDDVLRHVAATVRASVRAEDVVARLGGDEFAVLLPNAGPDDGLAVLERVRTAVHEASVTSGTGVSLSVGLVSFMVPPDPARESLKNADALMYEAKKAGKNRIVTRTVMR